ncbi:MAG: twin-arginine translocase TatA/TatE family subunit [Bacteroidaceae bacterium]|nr:twin-arginine translocase TatA/TatE family subunit [Bacteroidaceae bacterium]
MIYHTFLQIGTLEIVLVVLLIVLLFGGKKIPELMEGLGKGVNSFKKGMKEVKDEMSKTVEEEPEEKDKKDKESLHDKK